MQIRSCFLLAGVLTAVSCGCQQVDYTTPQRYDRGLVICLGGIGGITGEENRIRKGLNDGGVDRALEVFHWSRHNVLEDQTDLVKNKYKASQLARRIEAYGREYPGRSIHLIGVSAGTGLLVWALEDLAPGQVVDGAILIASSLHSKYDLTRALGKIQGQIHNFYSPTDPVLTLGAPIAGTVDRRHSLDIAGLVGFRPHKNANKYAKQLYKEKVTQHRWSLADILQGNIGDHLGATNPGFVRKRIAPLVLGQNK